jgi:hypothetical protein
MNGTWTTTGRICTDWTPAEDEAVRARARGEIGTAEAARRAGRSPDAVRSRAKRLGLDRPTLRAEADPAFAAKFRALAAEGYGVVAVARLMDLAPVMVRAMSRRLGLPLAGMRAVADGRAEADPAFAAKFRALVLGGATAPDVAAATGVAVVTAYVIARRMGLGWATARSRPAGSVGPRIWSAPWPQTAANAYHAIEEEEDGC